MSPQPSLMAALVLGSLLAQDAPLSPELPASVEGQQPQSLGVLGGAAPQDHSEGWIWRRTLQTKDAFVDLAQDPQDKQLLLAVDLRGGAWQSVDGGQSWSQTLDPAAPEIQELDEEALLLEAEATAQDFFEDEVVEGEEDDSEDLEGFAVDANDVDLLVQRSQGEATDPQLRIGGSLWFHPERGGVVLLSRSDGLWRSMDSGARWRKLSEASTLTSFLLAPDGSILAGSSNGVKLSRDGGANWRDTRGMDDVRVRDVAQSGGAFFAATDQGLYFSMDGMVWAPAGKMGRVEADLRALLVDPSMSGGLWIATDSEVLRSDDGGQSVFALSGTPLPGTANLTNMQGYLLAATRDGIWESTDGGVRWHPVSYGLPEPITSDVLAVGGYLVAATPQGLWRMEEEQEEQAVFRTGNTPGLSLDDTLYLALNRPGMRANTLRPVASLAPKLIPDLIVVGRYQEEFRRSSDYFDETTVGDTTSRWYVGAQLTWNGSNPAYSSVDGATDVFSGDTYYVLDGEVMSTQDATALPVAAANAQAKSVRYQRNVSGQVTDLYLSRSTLLAEQNGIPRDDLRAQTLAELKIQETTALLDAYTDGKFSTSASAAIDGETP